MTYIPGGPGADSLEGDGNFDTLEGFGGNDTLRGLGGNDTLDGGDGGDLLDGGALYDTVSYASATDGVAVDLSIQRGYDTGGLGEDTLIGIERVVGSGFDDALIGDDQDNSLEGGEGDDSIDGGGGRDYVSFAHATADVHFDLRITTGQDTGLGFDTVKGVENVEGGLGDDTLIGDDNANVLYDRAGVDLLQAGGGNDTIYSYDGFGDRVEAGAGNDNIQPDDFDTVWGGAGADTIYGGTVDYSPAATAGVLIELNASRGGDGDSLYNTLGVIGTAFSDTVIGNTENNVFHGGGGADWLSGNGGFDTLHGGASNDTLQGDAGNDVLYGEGGDDLFAADVGPDTLDGGSGLDTVSFANFSGATRLIVSLNATGRQNFGSLGHDQLVSIEGLIGKDSTRDKFTGNGDANILSGLGGDDELSGGAGDDTLLGGDQNDTLLGGDGNDSMDGGGGTDVADYGAALAGVAVDLSTTAAQNTVGSGFDALAGFEWLIGTGLDDTLSGGAVGERLEGGAGSDSLNGREGDDTLVGGAGNDTFSGGSDADTVLFVTGHAVTVNLNAAGPQNTGDGLDVFDQIENVTGGKGNDHLTGDGQDNLLTGGGGVDTLEGGGGNDTLNAGGDKRDVMLGGLGNDLIQNGRASYDDIAGPVTIDLKISGAQDTGSAGVDTLVHVRSVIGSDQGDVIAGDYFNNGLTGGGGADSLSGDVGADVLIGGASDDTLDGGSGSDRLAGGAGDDLLLGGQGKDTASYSGVGAAVTVDLALTGAHNTFGAGIDTLESVENLLGSKFDDKFYGNDGVNVITGGGGEDRLAGRDGADTFVFVAATDSTTAAADLITDLSADDLLDLAAIDADASTAGDQAFHVVSAFTGSAAEIVLNYDAVKDLSSLKADIDGDGDADMLISFRGDVTGMSDSWIL